ncbi:MAG: DUF4837 family protein [Capnocytophaga sp.]|nr:DUF4837 family protein [Capnocytophaga sp.]
MKKVLFYLSFIVLFTHCSEEKKKRFLPDSVGKINSLSIVIDNALWNGVVGDTLRNYFAQPVEDIPGEQEPIFSIQQLPHQVFKGATRYGRNVLVIDTDSKNKFDIRDTLFASPQKVAFLVGETTDDLISLIQKYAPQIIQAYKDNELKENQLRLKKSLNPTKEIEEKLNIKLTIPSFFSVVKQENNFFWLERKIKGGTSNLIIYEMPLNKICTDNSDCTEAIIHMRDSIGERYIPGREEGMYMITGQAFAPSIYKQKINNITTIESRGHWRVKNFILGGPFINYIFENPERNRCVVLEGFVSAPGTPKRDFLFELEAIIKTIEFL